MNNHSQDNHSGTMKTMKHPRSRLAIRFSVSLVVVMLLGLAVALKAQDTKTNSPAKDPSAPAGPGTTAPPSKPPGGAATNSAALASDKKAKHPRKELTGAELYSMHCARCHPERYPNERTAAQWKTIGMHMRVRANLPAEQYKKVLKYLQENSGY
jgi:hypothetical protein